jgi:hypothetical protein
MSAETKTFGDFPQIPQRQIAFVELMIGEALIDQVSDQLFNLGRGRFSSERTSPPYRRG